MPVSVPAPAASDWSGVEVALDVAFEPEAMGSIRGDLRLTSPDSGTYSWPLYGTAVSPRPRGPFAVPKAGTVNIEIKNVLRDDADFMMATDNVAFTLAAPTVRIGGKKAGAAVVKFTSVDGGPATGKLIVSCPAKPDLPPWVFYLQG